MSRSVTSSARVDRSRLAVAATWLVAVAVLSPTAALAYVGPGLGLGAILSFLALVGGVLLAILGFIWYPVKRLLRARRRRSEPEGED